MAKCRCHTSNPIGSLSSSARRCRISYRSSFVFVATDIHFQVNECDCFLSTCMAVVYLVESFRMASTVFRTAGIICLGLHVSFSFGSKKRCTDVGDRPSTPSFYDVLTKHTHNGRASATRIKIDCSFGPRGRACWARRGA